MLWHPESHERLVETPWSPAVVRDSIREIVAEAELAHDEGTATWPAHPLDVEPGDTGPWLSVYLGSAGIVWALDQARLRTGLGRGRAGPGRRCWPPAAS